MSALQMMYFKVTQTGIILLLAHPQVVYYNCKKFHQYRANHSGEVALLSHLDRWRDGHSDFTFVSASIAKIFNRHCFHTIMIIYTFPYNQTHKSYLSEIDCDDKKSKYGIPKHSLQLWLSTGERKIALNATE